MSITEVQKNWKNLPSHHKSVNEHFAAAVNADPNLKAHRDFVEQNVFGFGERSFQWLHKLIVDDMPANFSFMEIGVFKGQILSLYKMLALAAGKNVTRYGVTPLSTAGGVWESDYKRDIELIHETFMLEKDYQILVGLSTDPEIIQQAQAISVDVLYIDGGHDYATVVSDIVNYIPLIKAGGYLIIDDCANDMSMPWGYFTGIQEVTDATGSIMNNHPDYEFQFNVVHNKIWRKIR